MLYPARAGFMSNGKDRWEFACAAGTVHPFDHDLSPCLPCPSGSFRGVNDSALRCIPCPLGYFCATGSSIPLPSATSEIEDVDLSLPLVRAQVDSLQSRLMKSVLLPTRHGADRPYFFVLLSLAVFVASGVIILLLASRKSARAQRCAALILQQHVGC
jgi:hypothetical protein